MTSPDAQRRYTDPVGEEFQGPLPQETERGGGGSVAAQAFGVMVTKDGGVAGGEAAECTYTYTVKNLAETETLDTTVTPETPRLHYCAYWYAGETRTAPAVATSRYGLACYAADGVTLKLLTCFGEMGKDDAC